MKIIAIICITFVITLLTSWLLDWSFISKSYFRIALVLLLIIIEIVLAYFEFKSEINKK